MRLGFAQWPGNSPGRKYNRRMLLLGGINWFPMWQQHAFERESVGRDNGAVHVWHAHTYQ